MENILTNTQDFIVPIIVLACLVIGYVIKHTPYLDKIANAYIPLIVTLTGAILGVATSGLSIEAVIYGAVSGLASTGLHQAFTRVLGLDKEGEE